MFILQRRDVEIINLPNPQDLQKQIKILHYQSKTFRLVKIFDQNRAEALTYLRRLADDHGIIGILLEEPQRLSVWSIVNLDRQQMEDSDESRHDLPLIQGCLVLLQAIYTQIESKLGSKRADTFQQDLQKALQKGRFPKLEAVDAIDKLLKLNPTEIANFPLWDDSHFQTLLGELHRLALATFGNPGATDQAITIAMQGLAVLPNHTAANFVKWLRSNPKGKLWAKK
jgi:hypothetical protein